MSKPAPPDGVERRYVAPKVEFRAAKQGGGSPGSLVGYAAVFGEMSLDLGGFREVIERGAFAGCMGDDVRCLRNHDDNGLLGRSTAGTLRFEEDATGLRFECDLPNTELARDTAENCRLGNLTGCSFQFRVAPGGDDWRWNEEMAVRTITKFSRLYDVGPVTFPAYEQTSVACRSFDAAKASHDSERRAAAARDLESAKARQALADAFLPPPPA